MKTELDSAYAQTRLNLLTDRLLSFETLEALVSKNLDQIVARIDWVENQAGGRSNSPGKGIGRYLSQRMFADFQILLRPFHGTDYRFLKQAIRWFELVNLKVLIRGKFTGVSEAELSEQLVDLGYFADLPLQTLIETDDPFEMLRLLELTAYGGIVRQARRVFEEQGHDLFSLDSAIDRNFFIELSHRGRFLSVDDQMLLQQVFGVLMDRLNLLWLLRYRFSYGLSPAKSYYLLTASGLQLHAPELMKLARLESLSEVISELPPKLHALLQGNSNIFQIEQLMELYSMSVAQKGLSHSQSLITRTFCYLLLRESETRYLLAVIKGKQLGFDEDLIFEAVGGRA